MKLCINFISVIEVKSYINLNFGSFLSTKDRKKKVKSITTWCGLTQKRNAYP